MEKMDKSKTAGKIHRWGTGLFENDSDSLIIHHLTEESGVQTKTTSSFLYLGDVKAHVLRKHLDAGALDKMLKKHLPIDRATVLDGQDAKDTMWYWPINRCPGNKLCLLGAIMTQLGCKIRPDFRQSLEDLHDKVGLSRNAQVQLRHALNVYVDGIPYDFRWKRRPIGLENDDSAADPIWGDISEVLVQAGEDSDPAMRLMSRQIFGPMLKCTFAGDTEHPQNACGNCGKKKAPNGSPCRPCSLCGQRRYCSRNELAHRPKHQLICDDPDYRKMGNVWANSRDRVDADAPKKLSRVTELDNQTTGSDDEDGTSSAESAPGSDSTGSSDDDDLDAMPACGNCANLEILEGGNGPYGIFITCAEGGYQVIVLDPNHRVVVFGDAEEKVHESETEVLRTLLESTRMKVEEKYGKDQNDDDDDERPRYPPSNQGDRPREASFPGATPGGLFDTKPHGHFSFENDSNRQRPPHIPLPGTGPLSSSGMFSATSGRGLFGNSTDAQRQPTCVEAGQDLFGNNIYPQGQPAAFPFGHNANQQGQPNAFPFGHSTNQQGPPTASRFGPNTNAQGWHNGACQTPSAVLPANNCTNRAAGGLFGHCPSGQGLFGCSRDASGPSGAYDPRPFVPGLPLCYGLFAHPPGYNTNVTVNLNGLTISVYSTTAVSSKTDGRNNQNNNTANNQSSTVDRFKPGHRRLWSSPSSSTCTHADLEKSCFAGPFAPSARDNLQCPFQNGPSQNGPTFQGQASPGPATTPGDRKVPRGGLFGAQPDGFNTSTDVSAKNKSSGGLFGHQTAVPGAYTPPHVVLRGQSLFGSAPSESKDTRLDGPSAVDETNAIEVPLSPGSEVKRLWFGKHYKILAAEVRRAEKESTRLGIANLRVPRCIEEIIWASERLDNESGILAAVVRPSYEENREEVRRALEEGGWVPESTDFDRRVHLSATVEDTSSLSDAEERSNSGNNKSKGKAVDRPSQSTKTATSKRKVSPRPTAQDSAPAAKKDAASSAGGLMGSAWATAAKLAGHTPAVTEADDKSSGTIPELSSVDAAMRAAADQTTSVSSIPVGSMFAPKPAPSGVSIPETATTKQSPAPSSLFGSAPRSMFAPSPAPSPAPAPSSFAPSPFASGSFAPGPSAPGAAPSFGGPSVRPAVVPVKESIEESAGKSLEEPVEEAAKESAETEKPAAEKKKPKHGGLFDSQYAS
ncbi:hypothetical protein KCV06_g6079, partial [Aureobasidium melanogenum]